MSDSNLPDNAVPAEPLRPSRRQAVQWVMAAVAASALPPRARAVASQPASAAPITAGAKGYGGDPNLLAVHHPGDLWPLTFTAAQRKTATALADVILPKDDLGPAASEVGVPDMLDEWVSAPYPEQRADRPVILDGLAWIEAESRKRFGTPFTELAGPRQHLLCDDICYWTAAKPEYRTAAEFFSRFRSVCASAYYATPEGWKAIGYVGNTPLAQFDGPPPEVLAKLGVTQTVV